MNSIKFTVRAGHSDSGADCPLLYCLRSDRTSAVINSGFSIDSRKWDASAQAPDFRRIPPAETQCYTLLAAALEADRRRMMHIVAARGAGQLPCDAHTLKADFIAYRRRFAITGYLLGIADSLRSAGRLRTSETYRATASSVAKYLEGREMLIDEVDECFTASWQQWMRRRGLTPNTTSFYMRILRAACHKAADEGALAASGAFRNVYTGIDRTCKRALALSDIQRIYMVRLEPGSCEAYARDLFMLSFMLRGISLIDLSYLRKSDIQKTHLIYTRSKTGRRLSIAWTPEMQTVAERLGSPSSPWLIELMGRPAERTRRAYLTNLARVNRHLKKLGARLGLSGQLTMYVARHSWATGALSSGVPVHLISEGMGHSSERTTRIYLASLTSGEAIDRANARILSAL